MVIRLGFETQGRKSNRSVVIISNSSIHSQHTNTFTSKQLSSGVPYYCTPPVCVLDVLGLLAVWRKNKNKTKKRLYTRMCVPDVIERLTVWRTHNKTKNKESHILYAFSYPDRRIGRVGGVATFPNKTEQYLSWRSKHDV